MCDCFCVASVCVRMCVYVLFRLILHCEWRGRAAGDHVTRVRLNPGAYTLLRGHAGVVMWLLCPLPNIQTYTHTHTHTHTHMPRTEKQKHSSTYSILTVSRHAWNTQTKNTNGITEQPKANFHMTVST